MVTDSKKARVAVADSQPVFRVGLRAVFAEQSEFELIGEAADRPSILDLVERLFPDLVLLDVGDCGDSALDTVEEIKRRQPLAKLLVFTARKSQDPMVAAMKCGVNGYLTKDASIPELFMAMRSVLDGHTYLSPQIAGHLISAYLGRDTPDIGRPSPGPLSLREIQILRLVASGETNKQIGIQLFISPRTVEKHRANLMHKLNLKSTAAVLAFAIGNGLLNDTQALPRQKETVVASGLHRGAPAFSIQTRGVSGISPTSVVPKIPNPSPGARW